LVNVAAPPVTVHAPVPGAGLFPVKETVGVVEHTDVLLALAVAVTAVVTVTAEVLAKLVQVPLVMVHLNVAGLVVIEAEAVL